MHGRILLFTLIYGFSASIWGQAQQETPPSEMVFIPGGTFIMGSNENEHASFFPSHRVEISSFYMDESEVTNKEYYDFCIETGHKLPEFWNMAIYKSGSEFPDHPVVGVTHSDAARYADYANKRLPTEAEWEYAARGGLEGISFPYGEKANHGEARFNDPEEEKGPVKIKTYKPNGFGLYDMSGNVWEWVNDWFDFEYYLGSPEKDPRGPETGTFRVIRGGGWHSGGSCTSVFYRNGLPQHWVDFAGGFRCVKDLD